MSIIKTTRAPDPRDEYGRPINVFRQSAADLLSTVADSDAKKLLSNFIAIRSGVKISSSPKAQELAKNQSLMPREIFEHFKKRYALSVSDLPQIVGSVLEKVETPTAIPTHRKIVKFIQADNFMRHDFLISLDNLKAETVLEGGMVPMTAPNGLLASMTIETKRIRIPIPRNVVLSGALNIAELPNLLLRAAYRDEATATYAALESNPMLSDGAALFGTTNTATGATLHDLGAALNTFRNQKTSANSDELAHLEPKFFIVPVADEIAANEVIFQSGMSDKIEVVGSAAVTNSYLMADPEQAPVIIRLALSENPIIETRPPAGNSDAALILDLFHDYRVGAVTRVGVVKLTL